MAGEALGDGMLQSPRSADTIECDAHRCIDVELSKCHVLEWEPVREDSE